MTHPVPWWSVKLLEEISKRFFASMGQRDLEGPGRTATELERQTWTVMMRTSGLNVYLAELDGEPVGTPSLMIMPNLTYRCAPTAFIEAVVVVHQHRRRGIATGMLDRIFEDTRRAGCNKVQLLSHKRHAVDGAHRLYTSYGFEPEAEGFRLYLQEVPEAVQRSRATSDSGITR